MSHQVQDGKIRIRVCEINVAHHCNLSCGACSHLSPRAPRYFVRPDQVYRDLSILARHCRPDRVGLLGGEPLLHPDLLDVIDAVRESGVTRCIRVVTNGLLLKKMNSSFWSLVDEVHISLHPGHGMTAEALRYYRRQARAHDVDLVVRNADHFREPYADAGTSDEGLVRRIFSTCQIAHTWQCHAINEGYFYRCSQSIFIPRILMGRIGEESAADGLPLRDGEAFDRELHAFLMSGDPPLSCRYCLGTAGLPLPRGYGSKGCSEVPRTTEELLDWGHLEYLERAGTARMSKVLQAAAGLAKKVYSAAPLRLQVHPLVARGIAKMRRIHPSLR